MGNRTRWAVPEVKFWRKISVEAESSDQANCLYEDNLREGATDCPGFPGSWNNYLKWAIRLWFEEIPDTKCNAHHLFLFICFNIFTLDLSKRPRSDLF